MSVTEFKSPTDDRLIGLLIPASLSDLEPFYPHDGIRSFHSDWESLLQLIIVDGQSGESTQAHYHPPITKIPQWPTRHTVFICITGQVRAHLFEASGEHIASCDLGVGDALISTEGHQLEFAKDSRVLEVKQGPYPGSRDKDRVPLNP